MSISAMGKTLQGARRHLLVELTDVLADIRYQESGASREKFLAKTCSNCKKIKRIRDELDYTGFSTGDSEDVVCEIIHDVEQLRIIFKSSDPGQPTSYGD